MIFVIRVSTSYQMNCGSFHCICVKVRTNQTSMMVFGAFFRENSFNRGRARLLHSQWAKGEMIRP
jgi:hypothetical protein